MTHFVQLPGGRRVNSAKVVSFQPTSDGTATMVNHPNRSKKRLPPFTHNDFMNLRVALRIAAEDGSLELPDEEYERLMDKIIVHQMAAREAGR